MGEWHCNMCNTIYETSRQSRFNARYWMLGDGALGRPRGMVRGWRREEGSGWGTRVYLWWIHVDIWQNQHNIVKLKKKKKHLFEKSEKSLTACREASLSLEKEGNSGLGISRIRCRLGTSDPEGPCSSTLSVRNHFALSSLRNTF